MRHTFLIHSSADRHLGCFHVLAILNSAAVNTGVHISFQIRVFILSRYVPRSGIAGSYGRCIFSFFKEPACCFPVVAAPIYIPTSSVGGVLVQPEGGEREQPV